MTPFQASDHPLRSIQLSREEADGEDDAAATEELLAAVADLSRGWLEPLGVGILIDCREPERFMQPADARPPEPHHFLRAAGMPAEVVVNVGFTDALVREVAVLDAAVISAAVTAATKQPCAAGVASFGELVFTAVRVRLPHDDLVAMYGPLVIDVHVESRNGVAWAVGPTAGPAAAPVRLRASSDHGVSNILLSLNWSIWVDQPAIVAEALARVLARPRGWSVD
jgi:hypothetical protein